MQILTSTAELKHQRGSYGYFARIRLRAEVEDRGPGVDVVFSAGVHDEWREAASVGVRQGWLYLPQKHTEGKRATITVERILSMPCDTTEIAVLYVAWKAVQLLFDPSPASCPTFVRELGVYVF
jgi:hypothetical protein